jgi:hypothetical protein
MTKICSTCGIEKEHTEYYRRVETSDGLRNTCKDCTNKKTPTDNNAILEKKCNVCKQYVQLNLFLRDERTALGYGMVCLECSRSKVCSKCKERKDHSFFSTNNLARDGLRSACKPCENSDAKRRYYENGGREKRAKSSANYRFSKNTREGRRERMLLRLYHMTLEEYEELLISQNYVCMICKGPPDREFLSVDHDHKCCNGANSCGKCIRGLLCDRCNRAIGFFNDDPELVGNARDYLLARDMGDK